MAENELKAVFSNGFFKSWIFFPYLMIFQSFISPPFTVKTTYLEKLKPVQEIRVSGTYPNTPLVQFDKTPLKKKRFLLLMMLLVGFFT